eukprot:7215830-Karenia_brevis.AAC.1
MCSDLKCQLTSGLDLDAFVALVDDNTGLGCYCTDGQLRQLYEEFNHVPLGGDLDSTYWPSK